LVEDISQNESSGVGICVLFVAIFAVSFCDVPYDAFVVVFSFVVFVFASAFVFVSVVRFFFARLEEASFHNELVLP